MVQKLSKDVFAEITELDRQMQRLSKATGVGVGISNENMNNVNASGVLLGSAIDPQQRTELREMRQNLDHLYQQLHLKANIQDVCALLDAKAN